MSMRFGPFLLDGPRRQLLRARTPLHLTPKAFDLLSILVAQSPHVVSKRELHHALWPDTFVSDASLTGLIKELRRVLHDDGLNVPVIRTVHRIGYACGLEVERNTHVRHASHWLVLHGRRVFLRDGDNIIGRDPASEVCLEMPGVSRRHARIAIDADSVRLEDLGSKNGTTIGESRIRTAVALGNGDRLGFGPVVAVYRTSGAGISTETHTPSRTPHLFAVSD